MGRECPATSPLPQRAIKYFIWRKERKGFRLILRMRLYDMINSIGSGHHAQSSAVGDLYVAIRIRTTLPHQIQQSSSNIMETPFAASGDFIVAVNAPALYITNVPKPMRAMIAYINMYSGDLLLFIKAPQRLY